MNWARRVLTDTDDDGRYRSGLGAILGASIAILALLFGLDARTFLIATLIGSIVAAPLWRFMGEELNRPLQIVAFVAFLIASVIVLRQLPGLAFAAFLAGFAFTLGVLRFANGWRNPVPLTPAPELEPRPVQPVLVLALALPVLLLAAIIVIGVLVERGTFR